MFRLLNELVGDKIRNVFNAQVVVIGTFDVENKLEHQKYIIEKGERFYSLPRPYAKLRQRLIETAGVIEMASK